MGEPAIQAVADELEIRNLLARLAQMADDEEDLDAYLALFTEDAVWEGAAFGTKKGHEEILAGAKERRASGTSGPGTHSRHTLNTTAIEVHGDEASGRSVFIYYNQTNEQPTVSVMGIYQDVFRRTPDGWKMAHRTILSASA